MKHIDLEAPRQRNKKKYLIKFSGKRTHTQISPLK